MITSSSEFQKVIQGSHKIASKAVVLTNDKPVYELVIEDGNVRIDASNKFRRTADVKLTDSTGTMTPGDLSDLLHPLSGNEIALYRGAYIPSTRENEYIQLGVFVIKDTEIMDSGSAQTITLKLIDRALKISEARNIQPFAIYPGALLGDTIKVWTGVRYPAVKYRTDFSSFATQELEPGMVDRASDLWEVMTKLALDFGYDLLFDNEGYMDLRVLPQGTATGSQVVWHFHDDETSTTLSLRKDLTRDDTYNHVVAYGQTTNGVPPVWAEAYESNADHPLNIFGPMGDKPFFYSSQMLTTAEQCAATAAALLYKHLGHTEHIHFNSIVNPCLEDNDVIHLYRERSRINAYYSLDKVTVPLSPNRAMELDTRERFILA